jgi:hypothetical protein
MALLRAAYCLLPVIVLFSLFNCNKKMSDREFVELYVKIARATEANLAHPDTIPAVHEKIFKESGFSRQEFEQFKDKYKDQPEKFAEIWKTIDKKMQGNTPPPQ